MGPCAHLAASHGQLKGLSGEIALDLFILVPYFLSIQEDFMKETGLRDRAFCQISRSRCYAQTELVSTMR